MIRLARKLQAAVAGLSYSRAKRAVEEGQVLVDGAVVDRPDAWVAEEAVVIWDRQRQRQREHVPRVELLHVDADVVVAIKPAGLLTHASDASERDTLVARVALLLQRRKHRRPFLAVVQRLDKETSGVVVLAASQRGILALQEQLKRRSLERSYLALVDGNLRMDGGTFDRQLIGDGIHRRRWVAGPGERGKPAVTHFQVRERFASATLVEARLATGRTHQIRIHFAAAGFPLVGERVYRAPDLPAPPIAFARQALHAGKLGFRHPAEGRLLRFEAPLPEDLAALLQELRCSTPAGGRRSSVESHP